VSGRRRRSSGGLRRGEGGSKSAGYHRALRRDRERRRGIHRWSGRRIWVLAHEEHKTQAKRQEARQAGSEAHRGSLHNGIGLVARTARSPGIHPAPILPPRSQVPIKSRSTHHSSICLHEPRIRRTDGRRNGAPSRPSGTGYSRDRRASSFPLRPLGRSQLLSTDQKAGGSSHSGRIRSPAFVQRVGPSEPTRCSVGSDPVVAGQMGHERHHKSASS
jgi:hypothetical protein